MNNKLNAVYRIFWVLMLLILPFAADTLYGQGRPIGLTWAQRDSLAQVERDSLIRVKKIQDSIANYYIVIDQNRSNLYLDSLKNKVIVADNDFVSWMAVMKSLNKDQTNQAMTGQSKYTRPSWLLGIIGILLVGLGLVRIFFYSTFNAIMVGLFNERVLAQISKEDSILTSWPYIFLYLIFSMTLGLFALIYYGSQAGGSVVTGLNFLKFSGLVALLFVVKILLIRIISVIFETERVVREYISVLYLVYFNSAIFLLPLVVFLLFSPTKSYDYVLVFYTLVVSVVFIYRFLRTGLHLIAHLKFSIFYLILYLCTLEIAPILILVKTLKH